MNIREQVYRARPWALGDAVRRAHPDDQFDPSIRRVVADWVAYEQAASELAEARAEPHVHQYLVEAARIGRDHGRAQCLVLWWPLSALIFAIAIVVLLIKG